ncbi:SDR family NAD(P)-dependent oxidoreductase [Natrinema soli]|uniref:SDR family NAD(P)-dependent oxidoreductase n=1 Tax=Natrinema soli TaxID=1930624 RepID=A0ABD5SRN7_9EURY|nr:SDR family NAD(P)-dependent oxidoreductase [Natrinema soli]
MLYGAFTCTKAFYDDLETVNDGRVITISSVIGIQGNVGQANYAAAKSGLFGFTRSLALELRGRGDGELHRTGFTRTEISRQSPTRSKRYCATTSPSSDSSP